MNKEREMKTLIVAALVISVVAIGVGFAAFSTSLQINGTAAVQNSASWSVYFSNLAKDATSTEGVETTAPAITTGTIGDNTTNTKIGDFNVLFTAPNQKVVYNFTVQNDGTYAAKLTANNFPGVAGLTFTGTGANKTADENNVKKYIVYTLTHADGTPVVLNETIAANSSQSFKLTIQYSDFSTVADLPTDKVTITIPETVLVYSQAS